MTHHFRPILALWARRLFLVMLALTALRPATARAAFGFAYPDSRLAFDISYLPESFRSGDFSMLMWVWIDAPQSPSIRTIASIEGRFELIVNADGRIAASLLRSAPAVPVYVPDHRHSYQQDHALAEGEDDPQEDITHVHANSQQTSSHLQRLTAITSAPMPTGAWILLNVSFDRHAGKLSIYARSPGSPARTGVAKGPDWAPFVFGWGDRLVLGARKNDAMQGLLGLLVIRKELVTNADLDAVFASQRLFGPLDTDRRSVGGVISGESPGLWMIGHSMPTAPIGNAGGSTFERADVVGRFANKYNVTVYYSPWLIVTPLWNSTGTIASVLDTVYRSVYEAPYAGFFIRDRFNTGVGPGWVRGAAPNAAELLNQTPTRQIRMIASSNSRGVKAGDGSGFSPGNYAHGFIDKYLPSVSGILLRPAVLTSGGNPWFGFDCSFQNPAQSPAGTILDISVTTDNACDFGRFFTGSTAYGRGPGAGLYMLPGSKFAMRSRSERSSLMNAQGPLEVEAYVMAFPGASSIRFRSDRGANQQGTGIVGPWEAQELDTTRITLATDPIIFQTQTVLAFLGDQRESILVGDACVVSDGAAKRSISLVKSIAYDGIRTRATLEKPLLTLPNATSIVKFGPWQFVTLHESFPALPETDANSWRGIGIEADSGGIGLPLFAFSAVRPDVPGFVFGTAGWGGHGYQPQIDSSFAAADIAWMALTHADIWFQVPAEQLSTPASMLAYTGLVRAALPSADVVWAGESGLLADTNANWHQYIFDNSAASGVIGLSLLEHPQVGNLREQYADGMISDNDHYSQRGNRHLADLWVAQLRQALRTGCAADYDNNGVIDSNDLSLFQADLEAQSPAADVNADGVVNADDLLTFMAEYAEGCP